MREAHETPLRRILIFHSDLVEYSFLEETKTADSDS